MKPRHVINFEHIMVRWFGGSKKPVSQDVANRRSSICMTCPKRDPDAGKLSELISAVVKAILEFKNEVALHVPNEDQLGQCSVCECVLSLKVWAPIDHIIKTTDARDMEGFNKQDPRCWILEESIQCK